MASALSHIVSYTQYEIDKYKVKRINHSDRIKKDGLNLNTSQRDMDIETAAK